MVIDRGVQIHVAGSGLAVPSALGPALGRVAAAVGVRPSFLMSAWIKSRGPVLVALWSALTRGQSGAQVHARQPGHTGSSTDLADGRTRQTNTHCDAVGPLRRVT